VCSESGRTTTTSEITLDAESQSFKRHGPTPRGWAHVVFIGLSSDVGFFCLIWVLGKLEASRAVAFQVLGPITEATIEVSFGMYAPTAVMLLASALVLIGLLVSTRSARPT
jgi:drug/metabolite transporter (DMT)-like permease